MTGMRRSNSRGPIVEINMIPMIDVVLVLLIIFMVMTPLLVQQQIKINLPRSTSATESADRPIIVGIQSGGGLSLNGKAIGAGALPSELKALVGSENDRPVIIQADQDVPLQKVVSVMDIAKRANATRLGISVEQSKVLPPAQ